MRPHLSKGQPAGQLFPHSLIQQVPRLSQGLAVPGIGDMAVHETARKLTLAGLAFQWEIERALLGLQCVCHLITTDALTSGIVITPVSQMRG